MISYYVLSSSTSTSANLAASPSPRCFDIYLPVGSSYLFLESAVAYSDFAVDTAEWEISVLGLLEFPEDIFFLGSFLSGVTIELMLLAGLKH